MAASSPSISSNTDASASASASLYAPSISSSPAATTTITASIAATNSSKNLRGLNKPKCIKCGNVARSRCPYQSCKSCCAKAQNPCHIHVLKTNATFPDRTPSSSTTLFDHQSTEASPSGNSQRFTSLRQLSNNFSQFNNLQSPLRSRKPLTRKEAAVINEWRFLKLKEFKEANIEVENEAFDRYMQNVSLLEEVLAVNSKPEVPTNGGSLISNPNPNSNGETTEMAVAGMKLKLRSNPVRTENLKRRMHDIVNQGLRKLRKIDLDYGANDAKKQAERVSALSDLLDKLNKARNEEDLKSCFEMKAQIFNRHRRRSQTETEGIEILKQENAKNHFAPGLRSDYSPPMWFCTGTINQDALNCIDVHFSSLEGIESL
ncbi:uncharacterized protein LOC130764988 [Actinidia eriantha]|uniref:uncharacterized protein LOC130764988 n=1 Tax=Actinidia eriantha TaxID=165200 RepID=UPI0025896131|nr:uncharacterized protein LOC130764988 [Actinidia eriantha]